IGYTSLAVLPHLPLDELKVDQGFVMRSATSAADEAIVRSVCELSHRLGLVAVAEGVEDLDTATRLQEFGFDLLQGYYFARPMPEKTTVACFASSSPNGDGRGDLATGPAPLRPLTAVSEPDDGGGARARH
ncbi:MAG: EAL domain-containing protein, partial [Actinomycetes bacterium]